MDGRMPKWLKYLMHTKAFTATAGLSLGIWGVNPTESDSKNILRVSLAKRQRVEPITALGVHLPSLYCEPRQCLLLRILAAGEAGQLFQVHVSVRA